MTNRHITWLPITWTVGILEFFSLIFQKNDFFSLKNEQQRPSKSRTHIDGQRSIPSGSFLTWGTMSFILSLSLSLSLSYLIRDTDLETLRSYAERKQERSKGMGCTGCVWKCQTEKRCKSTVTEKAFDTWSNQEGFFFKVFRRFRVETLG